MHETSQDMRNGNQKMSSTRRIATIFITTFLLVLFIGETQAGWLDKKLEDLKKAKELIDVVKKKDEAEKATEEPDAKDDVDDEETPTTQTADPLVGKTEPAPTAHSAAATASSDMDVLGDSGGGHLGQFRALADGQRPMSDRNASILQPQVALASIFLHYYPESLEADSYVEAYARLFFNKEFTQTQRTEEYRTSLFKRRSIVDGWRTRLKSMETAETLTLNIFMPTMLNTNKYDFEAGAFPLSHGFALRDEALISSGVHDLTCLRFDRTFTLKDYAVPENKVKSFLAENRNSRMPGRGASVFVRLQIRITGKPDFEGAVQPRCKLAAEVLAIDARQYRGTESGYYAADSARPGAIIATYFSRDAAPARGEDSAVQVTYDKRTLPDDAPAEARAFNLETINGLIVMPPQWGRSGWFAQKNKALEALSDYVNFLSLGEYPDAYYRATQGHCMTSNYLSAVEDEEYFAARPGSVGAAWRGKTEFEQRRSEAAFKSGALAKLQQRAVHAPQRFMVLAESHLTKYDFDKQGFKLPFLNTTAKIEQLYGDCLIGLHLLPMADQLHEFWAISPAEAEKVLNSIPVSHKVGNSNIRTVYHGTVVELVSLKSAAPRRRKLGTVPQPPLRLKIISSHLYADKELTQKIYSPPIIRAAPSVLEAGMPESVVYSKAYQIEYGGANLLSQLKARGGNYEDWEWPQLVKQQKYRDSLYYMLMKPHYRPSDMPPSEVTKIDTQYTPFFPHGLEGEELSYQLNTMTDTQKALFVEWQKRQMLAMP